MVFVLDVLPYHIWEAWMPKLVIGVDEVGLGCLAGPVVAAAVVLPKTKPPIDGLADSKRLSHNRRVALTRAILEESPYWAIALSGVELINRNGIARCHKDCIRAVVRVCREVHPDVKVIIDGSRPIREIENHRCIVKADDSVPAVSAASIIAKVHRDNIMMNLARRYPRYGWENNKGYGTKEHMNALLKYGVTRHHRKDYAPVRRILANNAHALESSIR